VTAVAEENPTIKFEWSLSRASRKGRYSTTPLKKKETFRPLRGEEAWGSKRSGQKGVKKKRVPLGADWEEVNHFQLKEGNATLTSTTWKDKKSLMERKGGLTKASA